MAQRYHPSLVIHKDQRIVSNVLLAFSRVHFIVFLHPPIVQLNTHNISQNVAKKKRLPKVQM